MCYHTVFPCLLCGTIHALKILSYPKRKWRSPIDEQNHDIRIICIICDIAREQKKQHTKRLLPDFLKPYCRIRLDLSLEYFRTKFNDAGTYDWEDACAFLGCNDLRTAKRHLNDLQSATPEINLELSQVLVHKSGFFNERETMPDKQPVETLDSLVAQIKEYHNRLYGIQPPVSIHFYSALWVVHAWFCGLNLSTSYVLKAPYPHDTS